MPLPAPVRVCALLALLSVPPPSPAVGAADDGSGFARFVKQQTDAARTAIRKRDHAAAEQAWTAILELDPASATALEGLAELAERRGDADAEALARLELEPLYETLVADGDGKAGRLLTRSRERQAEVDPFLGEADALLAQLARDLASLGDTYIEDGMYANALLCWRQAFDLADPGSPEAAAARKAIRRCLVEGDDFVYALGLAPESAPGDKSEAWIDEHDRRTARWNRAASWDTAHYRIKTNAGWRVGATAAQAMDQVHDFYREIWGIAPDPPVEGADADLRDIAVPPIDVYIYGSRDEYMKRSGSPMEWSGGLFNGSEVHTFAEGGSKSTSSTLRTLFHEASHQFMDVAVGRAPSFINEGVACLFEGIELLPNGTIRRDLPVKRYLNTLSTALRSGQALSLEEVMAGKSSVVNKPEYYAYRWGLVYFLRMYVDDAGHYVFRDRLEDYLYEFKKGDLGNLVEHFQEFFLDHLQVEGITTFEQFESAWRRWILDLSDEVRAETDRVDDFRGRGLQAAADGRPETALRFLERAWEIDPLDVESIHGIADASLELGQTDRALYMYRRFLELAPRDDGRREAARRHVTSLDPHVQLWTESRERFTDGMADLARRYEQAGMPLMAMRTGFDVLDRFPYDTPARETVDRLREQTGRGGLRWQRLFNGFDLAGWYTPTGRQAWLVRDGELVCDYSLTGVTAERIERGVSTYRTFFMDRDVQGDWSMEVRIRADDDWEIAGLCFGAADSQHFEAVVLRHRRDPQMPDVNNVDIASFDEGDWSFRGDGSFKARFDPTSPEGTLLRIDVKHREVSVTIDGTPLMVIDGGVEKRSLRYALEALRGDAGLLTSVGVTRFSDMRFSSSSRVR